MPPAAPTVEDEGCGREGGLEKAAAATVAAQPPLLAVSPTFLEVCSSVGLGSLAFSSPLPLPDLHRRRASAVQIKLPSLTDCHQIMVLSYRSSAEEEWHEPHYMVHPMCGFLSSLRLFHSVIKFGSPFFCFPELKNAMRQRHLLC